MNKVITDGLVLMPPAFAGGLNVWSSEDGTPGSATYQNAPNAALVPADQDFGGCLELQKTSSTQKLRWVGETPILPGCYLRVTARVKAVSGNLPSVRIAGWAGGAGNAHVGGLVEAGPSVQLTQYGQVVEVSAIIGSGARGGVNMVWANGTIFGHLGLDLTGANGGIVRIDDIIIEDVTSAFLRTMMDWVDVRDYGAVGDGVTDDRAAFVAADGAAQGGEVLVPAGNYFVGQTLTMENPVRFKGRVTMPADQRLALRANFDLPSYVDAFGGDEMEGFRRAFQALINFSDHESLDMRGLRVEVTGPIDMQAAEGVRDTWEIRRVIRNGEFNAIAGPAWDPTVVTSQASYNKNNPEKLTNVANIANIPVGSLVTALGVGREVYVTDKNVGTGTLTISQPLFGPNATQTYTFTRFKYILDFSGFAKLSKFTLDDIEFQCGGVASGIMLCPAGETFQLRDCFVTRPRDRGVTSTGRGCQDLQIDRCHFNSNEMQVPATDRTSIAFNVNANDAKIRDNRFQRFGHTGIVNGNGHIFVGNHWFQGDEVQGGPRVAGIVFTETGGRTILTGNYIDNSFIELTNEHDAEPDFSNEYSFGGITMTGNTFVVINPATWFNWIVIKPYGPGHFLHGLSVTGNVFRTLNGSIDRIETVDTSIAPLDYSRTRTVVFDANTFNGVTQITQNPVTLEFAQNTASKDWVLNVGDFLPFGGWARTCSSIVAQGAITNAGGTTVFANPYVTTAYGANGNQLRLSWPETVKGKVVVTARVDNPV